jgi:hypothetical protein
VTAIPTETTAAAAVLGPDLSRDRNFTLSSNALQLGGMMSQDERPRDTERRFRPVFRDVQFWVPVAVLLGGLLVLAWIH